MQNTGLERENHKLKERVHTWVSISLCLLSTTIYLGALVFTSQMKFNRQLEYYLMEIEQHEEDCRNLKIENALLQNALAGKDEADKNSVEETSGKLK